MTICILVNLRDKIVAVSDGRLSRDNGSVSFDTAVKLSLFTPTYFYPIVWQGHIDRWSTRKGCTWCIAYAGNYALTTIIRDSFITHITNLKVARSYDNGGTPDFVSEYSPSFSHGDDYNFEDNEFPALTAHVIVEEFRAICRMKGNEWVGNRIEKPDGEFLLFGIDCESNKYEAFHVNFNETNWHRPDPVIVSRNQIPAMIVAAIGSPMLVSSVMTDETLCEAVRAAVPPENHEGTLDAFFDSIQASDVTSVRDRMMELAWNSQDPSVGGQLTVVTGSSSGAITLEVYQ